MKILNLVIPILMHLCSSSSNWSVASRTSSNEMWHNWWCQTIFDSISQDILHKFLMLSNQTLRYNLVCNRIYVNSEAHYKTDLYNTIHYYTLHSYWTQIQCYKGTALYFHEWMFLFMVQYLYIVKVYYMHILKYKNIGLSLTFKESLDGYQSFWVSNFVKLFNPITTSWKMTHQNICCILFSTQKIFTCRESFGPDQTAAVWYESKLFALDL